MQGHLALRYNAFAEIEWGFAGTVKSLTPLNPDKVMVRRLESGRLRYDVTSPNRAGIGKDGDAGIRHIPQENMFHLKGLTGEGIVGINPIRANRDTLGLTKAAEKYGAKFFGDKGHAGSVLQHPGQLSKEAQDRLRDSIKKQNATGTLVLEEGMKWEQLGIAPEEMQFLGTRQFQVVDIARIYRIPPHMIQDLTKSSFNNIEQQALEFVQYTMTPWFVRWEQLVQKTLLLGDTEYYVEFLINSLLRGAIKDRFLAYTKAISTGWLSRNEVRRMENLNSVEGLDAYLYPANLAVVGEPKAERPGTPAGLGAKPFGVLIKDAATRIAGAEIRAFARHDNKVGGWCAAYIKKHRKYVEKTLKPIYEAYEEASGDQFDYEKIAGAIIDCLVFGDTNRIGTITKIINESLIVELQSDGKDD